MLTALMLVTILLVTPAIGLWINSERYEDSDW